MPEKLDRCVRALMQQGYSESEAWRICRGRIEGNSTLAQANMPACKVVYGPAKGLISRGAQGKG